MLTNIFFLGNIKVFCVSFMTRTNIPKIVVFSRDDLFAFITKVVILVFLHNLSDSTHILSSIDHAYVLVLHFNHIEQVPVNI